jgi:hypothetical protein
MRLGENITGAWPCCPAPSRSPAMVVLTSYLSIAAAQNPKIALIAWKRSSTRFSKGARRNLVRKGCRCPSPPSPGELVSAVARVCLSYCASNKTGRQNGSWPTQILIYVRNGPARAAFPTTWTRILAMSSPDRGYYVGTSRANVASRGKGLRARRDDATGEPLPKRWMDLILYLDEQEPRRGPRALRREA